MDIIVVIIINFKAAPFMVSAAIFKQRDNDVIKIFLKAIYSVAKTGLDYLRTQILQN